MAAPFGWVCSEPLLRLVDRGGLSHEKRLGRESIENQQFNLGAGRTNIAYASSPPLSWHLFSCACIGNVQSSKNG